MNIHHLQVDREGWLQQGGDRARFPSTHHCGAASFLLSAQTRSFCLQKALRDPQHTSTLQRKTRKYQTRFRAFTLTFYRSNSVKPVDLCPLSQYNQSAPPILSLHHFLPCVPSLPPPSPRLPLAVFLVNYSSVVVLHVINQHLF